MRETTTTVDARSAELDAIETHHRGAPRRGRWIVMANRMTLVGIGVGIALLLQPWWPGQMRTGFFMTITFIVGQIVFSHLLPSEDS